MRDLGFGADKLKNVAAWGLEKVGRLKLNGELTGYSPLSRMVELEGLLTASPASGASGSPARGRAERAAPRRRPPRRLRDRAEEQRATVEELREKAAPRGVRRLSVRGQTP